MHKTRPQAPKAVAEPLAEGAGQAGNGEFINGFSMSSLINELDAKFWCRKRSTEKSEKNRSPIYSLIARAKNVGIFFIHGTIKKYSCLTIKIPSISFFPHHRKTLTPDRTPLIWTPPSKNFSNPLNQAQSSQICTFSVKCYFFMSNHELITIEVAL
ncbi:hypothetical protein [Endozoicomonas sp. 8E]|uniref:hypothetical protein n=1 Tax=Endozoicomonas sp. 8E TaxID=3035692 RepID=UPI0029394F51|nr:hypothetical protein [Endozoicomonas sp. 8E]WOG27255.1 hypothetical protein P6910_22325 [Endozoicomonas sp. 8E]